MQKNYVVGGFAVMAMLVLIFDTQTALKGAQDGIALCIQTVIPSLFPFFFISGIVNQSLLGDSGRVLRPLGRLCGIPAGAEPLLLLGMTGGYPVGAQAVGAAYENGHIQKADAQRMLGFCSNAGPAFIFGIAGSIFENRWLPWLLWAVLILSSLIVGMILPGRSRATCKISEKKALRPLEQAMRAMATVCGWVILFRVWILFLSRWILWIIPNEYAILLSGVLELTNGCVEIHKIADPAFQFAALAGLLSFGGLCVGLQTVSVTGKLNCKTYFIGKLLQALISIILSLILCIFLFPGK